jgi:hypothetical protein
MEEDGRTWRAGGVMEMVEGGQRRSSAVEMPAGGHSDVMENAKAARQSAVIALRNKVSEC